jgi:hypothetical protein
MITIAILREAGLSDAEILRILEIADQYQALSGAERTRRWRARKKAGDDVTSHRHNVTVTSHVTDALSLKKEDTKKERKKESTHKRGERLPPGWTPPDRDWEFALAAVGELTARANLDKFRDYWAAIPGQKGVKLDWPATWRNWIRRVAESNPAATQQLTEYEERCRNAEIREKMEAEYAAKRYGQKPNGTHYQGELLGGGPEIHQEELQAGPGSYDPTRH